MIIPLLATVCVLLLFALVVFVTAIRRVSEVVTSPDDTINLNATLEELIQDIRDRGYVLYLNSTCNGADAKYSALFLPTGLDSCDECNQGILPQDWSDNHHADTIEEAVSKAAFWLKDSLKGAE